MRVLAGQAVCMSCYRRAFKTTGPCHRCGVHRVLPGRDGQHNVCAECSAIKGFTCLVCGAAGSVMTNRKMCARCHLRAHVTTIFAQGNEPAPVTDEIIDLLVGKHPKTIARWTEPGSDHLAALLQLAAGTPIELKRMRATNAGRTLANVLRPRPDREPLDDEHHHLILFERWTQRFLPTIDDAGDRRTITMFASWHERRRLTRSIEIGTLRTWSTRCARQRIGQGAVFLAWLRDDQQTTLTSCNQTNIDTWFSTGNLGRQSAVAFIVWAKTQQLCDRRLRITPIKPATPPSMPRAERIALIARLITDIDLRLDVRVAGLLVALYAQPTSRICRIRRDAVTITDARIELKIGPRPIEPVEPFGALLQQLVETSNNRWLFPGDVPGEPCSPNTIGLQLIKIGVTRATRISAFHDLIEQIPGPVLADLIGYNPNFVAERAVALAALWSNYPTLRRTT